MKSVSQCVAMFQEADEFASLARNTKKRQAIVLNYLTRTISLAEPISRLGRQHVDKALALARQNHVVESSLNAYRTDLRRFGKWLLECGYVKTNPAVHLKNQKTKTPASKRKPINAEQAQMFLKVAAARHPRDGMTAVLLLMTGLRDSEIRLLQWKNADFENGTFNAYRPKNRDWHGVYWTPQLREHLEGWKQYVETKHGQIKPNWYVVPALLHRSEKPGHHRMNPEWPMDPSKPQWNMARRVKEWLAAVGETDLRGRASHTLRRTAGNLLLDSGAEPRDVQMFFGHESLAMTELYLDRNNAREKLKKQMNQFRI